MGARRRWLAGKVPQPGPVAAESPCLQHLSAFTLAERVNGTKCRSRSWSRRALANRERVLPIGQQGAEPGDEGDRMIEHDVMSGGSYLNKRRPPAKAVVHELAGLRVDDAVLGAHQRDPAVQP